MHLFHHNIYFVTDDYKWYGVVEYSAPLSQISSIRTELDWKMVDGYHIHCDFLDKSLSSYRKLNSKCLFVDNLPKDFTNTSEFRDIFSALSSPLYCQVWNHGLRFQIAVWRLYQTAFWYLINVNQKTSNWIFVTKNWNWQPESVEWREKSHPWHAKFLFKSN